MRSPWIRIEVAIAKARAERDDRRPPPGRRGPRSPVPAADAAGGPVADRSPLGRGHRSASIGGRSRAHARPSGSSRGCSSPTVMLDAERPREAVDVLEQILIDGGDLRDLPVAARRTSDDPGRPLDRRSPRHDRAPPRPASLRGIRPPGGVTLPARARRSGIPTSSSRSGRITRWPWSCRTPWRNWGRCTRHPAGWPTRPMPTSDCSPPPRTKIGGRGRIWSLARVYDTAEALRLGAGCLLDLAVPLPEVAAGGHRGPTVAERVAEKLGQPPYARPGRRSASASDPAADGPTLALGGTDGSGSPRDGHRRGRPVARGRPDRAESARHAAIAQPGRRHRRDGRPSWTRGPSGRAISRTS